VKVTENLLYSQWLGFVWMAGLITPRNEAATAKNIFHHSNMLHSGVDMVSVPS